MNTPNPAPSNDSTDELVRAVPRLLEFYNRGALVPFLGAGMSYPACAQWGEFVDQLGRIADEPQSKSAPARAPQERSASELVNCAALAVRKLKNQYADRFPRFVKLALRPGCFPLGKRLPVPPASEALARIWWPLVLTTNYDDWFLALWNRQHLKGEPLKQFERMEVVGRSSENCYRVLSSLRGPENPLLWALHGFLRGLANLRLDKDETGPTDWNDLQQQLVIGHEEYRRQVHNSLVFRRAFAEVFRSRSFLFLGTSLSDPHFLGLFDEILELLGPIPHMHFALLKRGSADVRFLRERLQIHSIEYRDHSELPSLLDLLKERMRAPQPRVARWTFELKSPVERTYISPPNPELQIVRGALPMPKSNECVALSAGMNCGRPWLGRGPWEFYKQYCAPRHLPAGKKLNTEKLSPYLFAIRGSPVFLVAARATDKRCVTAEKFGYRDARVVAAATADLMTAAAKADCQCVHAMLLAAGRGRTFPPYVSLVQMVRGFRKWRDKATARRCPSLHIHVINPVLLHMLESRRLDVEELLVASGTRFWFEIHRTMPEFIRSSEVATPNQPVVELLRAHNIPESGWRLRVIPRPTQSVKTVLVSEVYSQGDRGPTVEDLGLLPGSTLRVSRCRLRKVLPGYK